jgi:predicted NBD/HSP70 family sugar kinase
MQSEAHYLGLELANHVTLFTPELISLGGGLMKCSSHFLDSALQVVKESCTRVPAYKTHIVLASPGSETGLLGAASAWLHWYRSSYLSQSS